ncbi:hypothetical protein L0337_33795 [candidate division KSB1 bacterium]|nr:hypothetical protein [candidate division KSB1 bacterium]
MNDYPDAARPDNSAKPDSAKNADMALRKIVRFEVLNDIDQAKNFLYQVVF